MAGLKRDNSKISENSSEPASAKKQPAPWLSKRMKATQERQGLSGSAGGSSTKPSTSTQEAKSGVKETIGTGMAESDLEAKSKVLRKDDAAPPAGGLRGERVDRQGGKDAICGGNRSGSGAIAAVDATSNDKRRTIFVGDLSLAVKKPDLRKAFARFGKITSVKVIPEQCYGFVTFASEEAVEAAHKAAGTEEGVVIADQRVRVRSAEGSLPSWKVGAGGFSFSAPGSMPTSPNSPLQTRGHGRPAEVRLPFSSPCSGNPRETYEAAALAAHVTAGALLYTTGGHVPPEMQVPPRDSNRRVVAYDDLL